MLSETEEDSALFHSHGAPPHSPETCPWTNVYFLQR
jgi:hypothetical protein